MFIRQGQSDRQSEPARRGAAGGKIGEADGERLVAERARPGAGRKVPPFDQHVGSDRELVAGANLESRAIVAYALHGVLCRAGEETANDLKFVQARFLDFANSSGRSAAAIFSSTPLTKRCPSVPPKLLPSSTASFSTTLNGVPGWDESS